MSAVKLVAILVFDGFDLLEACSATATFELASALHASPVYDPRLVSIHGGPVRSSSGVVLDTMELRGREYDTVLVVGGEERPERLQEQAAAAGIESYFAKARRVAGVGSGIYLLASAGFLAAGRFTTHWALADELRRRRPDLDVRADPLWMRNGPVITGAGGAATIDIALALVTEDLGQAAAQRCAQELVHPYPRPNSQAHHAGSVELNATSDEIVRLVSYVQANLAEPLPVAVLAAVAGLSERKLRRALEIEVGLTPAKLVERLRLAGARRGLQDGLDLTQVASAMGFRNVSSMRLVFMRVLGQPPQSFRRRAMQTAG